jgi:hypothetical protein
MAAGRAVEPVFAKFALDFGKSLLFAAFGTLAIHFAVFNIVFKQQTAEGAGSRIVVADNRAAIGQGTNEHRLAGAAPVFSFFHFFTNGTFFHDQTLMVRRKPPENRPPGGSPAKTNPGEPADGSSRGQVLWECSINRSF